MVHPMSKEAGHSSLSKALTTLLWSKPSSSTSKLLTIRPSTKHYLKLAKEVRAKKLRCYTDSQLV